MSNSNWEVLKTIPKAQNFQESLRLMESTQVDLNIAEISLLTLTTKEVQKWYGSSMMKTKFYLKVWIKISKYRYVLESLLNGKVSETLKSTINFACSKFDQQFVNGEDSDGTVKTLEMYKPFKKQSRLNFIIGREEISFRLNQLSHKIFQIEGEELKRQFFQSKIAEINNYLIKQELQVVMPLKDKLPQEVSIYQQMKGMYICRGQTMQKVKEISLTKSYYIKTKNRHPLVLDFGFARYIYKNDEQLSHEILAIQLGKYINAILGKEYIITYEIIPEKYGAFYQFVQNSKTISEIKSQHQNSSLLPYFQKLCENHTPENILGKFAQTYSGFCLIQYLLDIKDRNNANIMIRQDGAIFHIDLAFILSSGPGGMNFQSVPFKMPREYIKILGGFQSDYFKKFQVLLVQHFTKLVQCKDELMWKLKTLTIRHKEIRCLSDFSAPSFSKKIPTRLQKVKAFTEDLIDKSYDSWKTNKYDDYQFSKNGIFK